MAVTHVRCQETLFAQILILSIQNQILKIGHNDTYLEISPVLLSSFPARFSRFYEMTILLRIMQV